MDTKIAELSAARTELQMHLANVTRKLFVARTAQMFSSASGTPDNRPAENVERLEEQQRALHGILVLICDRLRELEPLALVPEPVPESVH